jgi:hypothetical protein
MINYSILDRSVVHYEKVGFVRVESPWTVTAEVSDITKPKDIPQSFQLNHNSKVLVASGEQSFLYLYLKGFLPKGSFQTITPCWRYESFSPFHTKYFIKNELIRTDEVTDIRLNEMIEHAAAFFTSLGFAPVRVKTEIGYDLYHGEVELGSYGIRSCDFLTWIYGTGVAEPRASSTLFKYGIPLKANS